MGKKTLIFSLVAVSLFVFSFNENNKYFDIARNLDIFATLFKEVNTYYVDEIDPEKLIKTGIDAMLESLDPYTSYIPEEEIESFRTITSGQYAGIGAVIGLIDSKVRITRVYKNFAAHRSGLRVGDEILTINDQKITTKNISEVSSQLKGQLKTSVEVTVARVGSKAPLTFTVEREKITVSNVSYFGMLSGQMGYIKLEDFATGAGKEVKNALLELKKTGAKSIILDLRGNPGGLLSEAVNVSNVFIPKSSEVVSTKGKIKEWNSSYKALNQPVDTEIPLVVLIDYGSASASEIVAGVIQDYDRGILLGRKTYGKGLVQTTRPLSYNSQLKVTTAKYYIPSGRCIQAVDYSHRDASGHAEKYADSLLARFTTKSGRVVYDGSGLIPDIIVNDQYFAPISIQLANRGLIFNYADEFFIKNDSIAQPSKFQLSDIQYNDFIQWLKNKDYTYITPLENSIEKLITLSQEENYYTNIESELNSLRKNIANQKNKDLSLFQNEINGLLSTEIAGRYYLYSGEIETSFKFDQDIKQAMSILGKSSEYNKVLNK
ncbi:MAG: S41 family peptidase [Cyclobacteriaceae bacterium]|nr:S41 family peptidase [Cyclobacteriaceae bacterium]